MFAAFTLVQAKAVRASIEDSLVLQRFCVLVPSVNSTITLSRSGAGAEASVNGRFDVRACQPHTNPIVTLVLPAACIASTLEFKAVQSVESGIAPARAPQFAAG